ncbi:MAG: hypothetical protein QOH65_2649 [Methylobacteriaceae bacterium]|jgi:hypothetical protein|nr:hypothetical protein [Methylobacteriaceae bacterium]
MAELNPPAVMQSPAPAPALGSGVAKLEIFISYASEDVALALAMNKALTEYLDTDFANIWIDIEGIRAGFDLADQIRAQLDKTDVLIVIYTGQQKGSHGFTGLEIGYFMGRQSIPGALVSRRIVSFYVKAPPGTTSGIRGVPFGIDEAQLAMSEKEYEASLATINENNSIALFVKDLEADVDVFRRKVGLGAHGNSKETRLAHVRALLLATFCVFKTRKETEVNPQKKLVITVSENLSPQSLELPGSSILTPADAGVMQIFGLQNEKVSWENFLTKASEKYRLFWKDTIEYVILSSLDRLDADNSQIILSEKDEVVYRVILSQRAKYYNSCSEFHLYFVEILRRHDFGDEHTTNVLKALGLCCRFRFMFFEKRSEFSSNNFSVRSGAEARDRARRLVRELNLLRRDSIEAQLDDPSLWADLLDWPTVSEMNKLYNPLEQRLRTAAVNLVSSKDDSASEEAKSVLIEVIKELEAEFNERNGQIIRELADHLGKISAARP